MDPEERNSPHWKDIVGENWPEISPREWGALETLARDGAEALDPEEADRARRAFEDSVRSSAGLDPIKDDLRAQQGTLRGFVDALVATADTFGHIAGIVDRTRTRILDIVYGADREIRAVPDKVSDEDGDGSTADEERAEVKRIIARARAEVADVAAHALTLIGPGGLPELSAIAAALGQPGPWDRHSSGGPGNRRHSGPHAGPGPRHHGDSQRPHGPHGMPGWPDGRRLPDGLGVPRIPALDALNRLFDRLGLPPPFSPLPGGDLGGPHGPGGTDSTLVTQPPTGPQPGAAPQSQAPDASSIGMGAPGYGSAPDSGYGAQRIGESAGAANSGAADSGSTSSGDSGSTSAAAETLSTSEGTSTDHDVIGMASKSGTDRSLGAELDGGHSESAPGGLFGSMPGAFAGPIAPPPVVGPPTVTAPPTTAPPAAAGPTASPSAPGMDTRAPQGGDSRISGAGPRASAGPPSASGVSAPGVSVPPGKNAPPQRPVSGVPVESDATPEDSEKSSGSDHMRDAVGAAMIAAAAPTFMVGERVDGDLALARTLLSSLLAAAESATLGTAWAVSVMRHPGGIGAFVTSNEGQGWLPAGVYLPRELSTPWVWSVSDSAWEGIADPARVLAEFALSWGKKTGARLTAVASSLPIEDALSRQMGDVPTAGSVGAAAMMDFAGPASGLVDRLELVGAPQLLDRAASVPADRIGWRCVELAVDAHARTARLGPNAATALGTAAVRERILQAFRQAKPVPAQWWEELRDADDLVVASMLPLKADVSRVPLGELRSETAAGRSASDASVLRSMLFERRCDELVLLLAEESSRQRLRDAIYAHGQLVDHPAFTQMSSQTPPPAPRRSSVTAPPTR
ncbi:hypothetical protein [Nocardia vinacea]|uniref:hypothetical protein n=1 Tax=Nocardia vinacea TaxID=96468 RepID=UPI0002F898B8|nr:hypothetical protein [Nocardia vinacea]